MDPPVLELKIVAATDLKKPGPFSAALQPYVVAAVSGTGGASPSQKTAVDPTGGRNPTWNQSLALPLPGGPVSDSLSLRLQILSRRSLAADNLLGEVSVPLLDLLRSAQPGKFVSYQVLRPSGRPKGVLTFSYNFSGKVSGVSAPSQPVIAYSATTSTTTYPPPSFYYPPSPMPSAPPPPPPQMAYPPPHQPAPVESYGYPVQGGYGYGYPSGQPGYGYGYGYNGPVVQPNRKKASSGLGLGAGLLGGALAGFLVGDLVSDVGGGFF